MTGVQTCALPISIILIAEDIAMNALLIKALVKKFIPASIILEATNGREALELIMTKKIDIVLMDVQMPEMSGIEATKKIRDWEALNNHKSHLPIIALTAGASQEEQKRSLQIGMDDFITKPIIPKILKECLQKHL